MQKIGKPACNFFKNHSNFILVFRRRMIKNNIQTLVCLFIRNMLRNGSTTNEKLTPEK